MKFLTIATAAVLLAGIGVAAAQSPQSGKSADELKGSQAQERNPNGSTGGSKKNPSPNAGGMTTGSATSGGHLVPKNHKGAGPGYDVKKNGVNKGEVGGEAEQ
ncbi:MAG TPA: hypothetical protein VFX37_12920 [Pseudolabrys sp.]|nr:hypothetical protein [Pseudolabrys sp.]